MSDPILVTGAAGFVGGHLLDLLTQQSSPIVGWYHPQAPPTDLRDEVRWVPMELLDRDRVTRAIAEMQPGAVYHLAGAAHVGQSFHNTLETYQGNVLATHYLFEALRVADIRPPVFVAGSAMVYRSQARPIREDDGLLPASPYATSKLAQEMLARHAFEQDRLPTVIARSFNQIGPRQDASYVASGIARQIALIEAGRQDPVLTVGSLEPQRDLTDVRDTVRAYVSMMLAAKPGQPYNVCSGQGVSVGALVDTFVRCADRPVRIVQDPARFRTSDPLLVVGDRTRLTTDTGWTPQIPFERTVDDLLEYWRQRIRAS